jgi:hypothetical protein
VSVGNMRFVCELTLSVRVPLKTLLLIVLAHHEVAHPVATGIGMRNELSKAQLDKAGESAYKEIDTIFVMSGGPAGIVVEFQSVGREPPPFR